MLITQISLVVNVHDVGHWQVSRANQAFPNAVSTLRLSVARDAGYRYLPRYRVGTPLKGAVTQKRGSRANTEKDRIKAF